MPVCVIEPVFWVSLPVADFEDVCVAVGVGELSCLATMAPASGSHPGQADATEDSDSSMAAVLIADIWSFISKL